MYKFLDENVLEKSVNPITRFDDNITFSEVQRCLLSEGVQIDVRYIPILFDIFIRVIFAEPCLGKNGELGILALTIYEDIDIHCPEDREFMDLTWETFGKIIKEIDCTIPGGYTVPKDLNEIIKRDSFGILIKEFTILLNDILALAKETRKKYEFDYLFTFITLESFPAAFQVHGPKVMFDGESCNTMTIYSSFLTYNGKASLVPTWVEDTFPDKFKGSVRKNA